MQRLLECTEKWWLPGAGCYISCAHPFRVYSAFTVWVKKSPLRTCGNFSKTVGNFSTKFYVPITRSYLRYTTISYTTSVFTVWIKKIPPEIFWHFSPNGWEFLVQISYAYYTFLSTLDYDFLFNYLQLWRSYPILSVTTDHPVQIMCAKCPPSVETHAGIFWHFPQIIRNC